MTLLEARLGIAYADDPQWIRLSEENENRQVPFTGRYLRINGRPFSLGRQIGHGEEALIFELIDLRSGEFNHVVKICRFRRHTSEYKRWAVPIRFQRNTASWEPEIEFMPAKLFPLPDGGVVKVQRYVSASPATDWLTRLPAIPVLQRLKTEGLEGAEQFLDHLVEAYGDKAILLEFKGRLSGAKGDLDVAAENLIRAVASHSADGSSSRYIAAIVLTKVLENIYQKDRSRGDAETSLTLDDGTVLRNTFFASPSAAALDDSLQDRPLFSLIEVMADEPYFVQGLNAMQESLIDLAGGAAFKTISEAVTRIDPTNPLLQRLREAGLVGESEADSSKMPGTEDIGTSDFPSVPDRVLDAVRAHDTEYQPEVPDIRSGAGRLLAAVSNIRRQREDLAEDNLKTAVHENPHDPDVHIAMASFLSFRGRNDEAARGLKEAIVTIPGAPVLRLVLAKTLIRSGEIVAAELVLSRARPLMHDWEHDFELLSREIAARRQG